MADNYISTNMESGVKVKEALERIESYEPGLFVWTEVSDSVTVNLKSPTTYSGIKDPGDYVIYKFSNGPAKIPSTLAPVLLSLRNGEICVTANNMVFMLNGDNWVDMSESTDTDTTIFVKSDIAPVRTKNCYWFDTSKYATEGYITLKYYDTDTSTWTSVFNEERYLKKSELDPDNKNTDVYDYITTKVAGVVGEYGEFMKHVANQLTYIHVSADDRKAYGKIITKDQLQTLLEKTYTPAVKTVIDQTVSDGLGTTALENSLATLKDNITSHLEGHVTAEDITRWKNKAEKNHTHDYTQGNTKLDASQIVSGTFGEDQLPDEIKDRYYKITAASPAAEFSSSSITAAMRKGKYHNGNGFYFETTDSETGKVTRQWYRIIDSSKVGTSNWAQGVVDFTATEVNLDWNQISGKPSSLEEFGITTDLYTKTEIDEKFSSYDSNITELNKNLETANEEVSYEFGVKEFGNVNGEWNYYQSTERALPSGKLTYGNGVFLTASGGGGVFSSVDGKTWNPSNDLSYTSAIGYANNKLYIIGSSERGKDKIIYFSSTGNFQDWNESIDIDNTNLSPYNLDLIYGKGLYILYSQNENLFFYGESLSNSMTSISFSDLMPNSSVYKLWFINELFILCGNEDGLFYSTDFISGFSKCNANFNFCTSIAYGNGKFVTAHTDYTTYAYSTDGINWIDGTLPRAETKSIICFGNNIFVILIDNGKYLYSTDGINWTEDVATTNSIDCKNLVYGNNIFLATNNYEPNPR